MKNKVCISRTKQLLLREKEVQISTNSEKTQQKPRAAQYPPNARDGANTYTHKSWGHNRITATHRRFISQSYPTAPTSTMCICHHHLRAASSTALTAAAWTAGSIVAAEPVGPEKRACINSNCIKRSSLRSVITLTKPGPTMRTGTGRERGEFVEWAT